MITPLARTQVLVPVRIPMERRLAVDVWDDVLVLAPDTQPRPQRVQTEPKTEDVLFFRMTAPLWEVLLLFFFGR